MLKRQKLIGVIASVALAAVGTGLLVTYVRSAEDRALKGERTVSALVVVDTIPKGTRAEDITASVRLEQVPTKVLAHESLDSTRSLAGKVAAIDLLPGDQLVATRFATPAEAQGIAPGMLQVTVSLDSVRAIGGQVRKGDSVAVAASFAEPETTHLILQKVAVTDVRTEGGVPVAGKAAAESPTGKLMVTLALDAPSVERVIFAAEHGALWLSWQPKEAGEAGTKVQTRAAVNL